MPLLQTIIPTLVQLNSTRFCSLHPILSPCLAPSAPLTPLGLALFANLQKYGRGHGTGTTQDNNKEHDDGSIQDDGSTHDTDSVDGSAQDDDRTQDETLLHGQLLHRDHQSALSRASHVNPVDIRQQRRRRAQPAALVLSQEAPTSTPALPPNIKN